MTSENSQADLAPTRRSSRRQAAPAETPQAVEPRLEKRTRLTSSRPATVWGTERTDATTASEPRTPATAPVADAPATALTRKELRALALAQAATAPKIDEPVVPAARETPVDVALSAIDDAAPVTAAVDVVAVSAASPAELDAPAGIPVTDAADPDDVAFAAAVLVDDEQAHAIVDEFEAAARLFAFTGETPIQVAAAAIPEQEPVEGEPEAVAPRRRRFTGASFKRATAASASVGAMGIVGLLAIGLTTPAQAVAAADTASAATSLTASSTTTAIPDDEIQAYIAPADAQSVALDRSDYTTASTAQIAAESGISHYSNFFTNNANSAIQWPFAVGVSISYGFGMRSGTMHEGLDFTPGEGAQIQAVADGTVRTATESGGGYGVMIIIDHVVDGELVSTRYGHMQHGSLRVKAGDTVKVGQIIGLVGNTGHSFGAHLHFEVLKNGTTAIDPLSWLREHAGG